MLHVTSNFCHKVSALQLEGCHDPARSSELFPRIKGNFTMR